MDINTMDNEIGLTTIIDNPKLSKDEMVLIDKCTVLIYDLVVVLFEFSIDSLKKMTSSVLTIVGLAGDMKKFNTKSAMPYFLLSFKRVFMERDDLSARQEEELLSRFKMIDFNKDGKISYLEMMRFFSSFAGMRIKVLDKEELKKSRSKRVLLRIKHALVSGSDSARAVESILNTIKLKF